MASLWEVVIAGWDLVRLSGRESPVVPQDDPYRDTMALGGRGVHDPHQGGVTVDVELGWVSVAR